jgi:diacylglycerol O-acyltransferase / wax synthase
MSNYPTSIVVHGMALNITVQSYDQQMDFGLMADAAAMPDVRALADALRVAFDDLCLMDAETSAPPALADTGREVVGTARRRLMGGLGQMSEAVGGAVGNLVGGVVKGAMTGAVQQAVAAVVSARPARRAQARAEPDAQRPAKAAATKRGGGKAAPRIARAAAKAIEPGAKRRR